MAGQRENVPHQNGTGSGTDKGHTLRGVPVVPPPPLAALFFTTKSKEHPMIALMAVEEMIEAERPRPTSCA